LADVFASGLDGAFKNAGLRGRERERGKERRTEGGEKRENREFQRPGNQTVVASMVVEERGG
jgi:hypothetical protein